MSQGHKLAEKLEDAINELSLLINKGEIEPLVPAFVQTYDVLINLRNTFWQEEGSDVPLRVLREYHNKKRAEEELSMLEAEARRLVAYITAKVSTFKRVMDDSNGLLGCKVILKRQLHFYEAIEKAARKQHLLRDLFDANDASSSNTTPDTQDENVLDEDYDEELHFIPPSYEEIELAVNDNGEEHEEEEEFTLF
ncbi:hypothetical protein BDB00DRAFT_785067 [Zychaea mexicana]|uniref:uncharacterized protein n=1 Tax=Zychaea mexicana TaxID=64656 RepID=UPI0022FE46EB|nr:uncharacterized protein BDB00DRAFT_785067 [Zychaea mexicana]KAI9496953.1 hypothetical protein BDB00DRAFT_785067 [Zychaea mexicana]